MNAILFPLAAVAVLLSGVSAYPTSNGSVLDHAIKEFLPLWPLDKICSIWKETINKSEVFRAVDSYLYSEKFGTDLDKVLASREYKKLVKLMNDEDPLKIVRHLLGDGSKRE